ncbi:MAG: hypothetical protein C0614_10185, partial [Desulfuromonas sp.]
PARAWARPAHLQVEVTTHCNLKCVMCSHASLIKTPQHMTLAAFQQICSRVRPCKIALSGIGEPLLNPEFLDMVRYARKQNIATFTTTNLTLISRDKATELVASGLQLIKGSIDSLDPETYRVIRGQDAHCKVVDGLNNLLEARRQAGTRHPYIRLQFVMQQANFPEIPEVVDFCAEGGVDAIYFQPLDPVFDQPDCEQRLADLPRHQFHATLQQASEKASASNVVTNLPSLLRDFGTVWRKYQVTDQAYRETGSCMMPWTSLYIAVDGGVRLCCAFASSPEMTLGNIFEDDFESIWNGAAYQAYRRQFAKGQRVCTICQTCLAPTLTGQLRSSGLTRLMFR